MIINNDSQDIQNEQIANFVNAMRAANARVELEVGDNDKVVSIKINDQPVNPADLAYFSRHYGLKSDVVPEAPVVVTPQASTVRPSENFVTFQTVTSQ